VWVGLSNIKTTRTLTYRFGRVKNDRFIQTAQMQAPLGKGNFDFCFPESAVNLLVKFAADDQSVIGIQ